jgi:hypothetical protein
MTDTSFTNCRANRDRLIAALDPFGIARVIVTFDGSGDEGQIEDIAAYNAANETLALPAITVHLVSETQQPAGASIPLAEALENFAYDTLGEFQGGWQDNDGAYGTITLDVANGAASLDFNARFTDVHNSVIDF